MAPRTGRRSPTKTGEQARSGKNQRRKAKLFFEGKSLWKKVKRNNDKRLTQFFFLNSLLMQLNIPLFCREVQV